MTNSQLRRLALKKNIQKIQKEIETNVRPLAKMRMNHMYHDGKSRQNSGDVS